MDLLNLMEHKKGTKVLVNGTIYDIGVDGVAKDVKDEDAAKLLQNSQVWKKYDPKKASALRKQAKEAQKGRMQLIGADGVIPKADKPGDPMDPAMPAYKRPTVEQAPEETPPEQAAPETTAAPPEEDEVAGEQPQAEASEADRDWPDPDESMDIAYLRQMAEAYDVVHNIRTPKKTLVKRINAAMYE